MISLAIMLVLLMILATITMYYGNSALDEAKLQDLKTNMLLIQASLRGNLEQYHFEANGADAAKKNELKNKYFKGKKISDNADVRNKFNQTNAENKINNEIYKEQNISFDYYYLDPSVLASLGIKNVNSNGKDGYYIVAYSLDDTYPNTIEVINTKGYRGIYTLTELMAI